MSRRHGGFPGREFWHFMCDHGRAGIGTSGLIHPHPHVLLPELGPLVWLTTLSQPAATDVGLTSTTLRCDRRAYRYRVVTHLARPWAEVRAEVDPNHQIFVEDLERYGKPATWWVMRHPVLGRLAPIGAPA